MGDNSKRGNKVSVLKFSPVLFLTIYLKVFRELFHYHKAKIIFMDVVSKISDSIITIGVMPVIVTVYPLPFR